MTKSVATTFARIGAALAASGHGALLVIAEKASEEAERLGNQSLSVEPTPLSPELASKFSQIDGCHPLRPGWQLSCDRRHPGWTSIRPRQSREGLSLQFGPAVRHIERCSDGGDGYFGGWRARPTPAPEAGIVSARDHLDASPNSRPSPSRPRHQPIAIAR